MAFSGTLEVCLIGFKFKSASFRVQREAKTTLSLGEDEANRCVMLRLMDSTQFTTDEVDLEGYRARLRNLSDEELIREGKAGRYMCSPLANFGKPPRKVFVIQLEEVKAEWRRRHPQTGGCPTAKYSGLTYEERQ